jgi:uncharacterized protein Veg
MTGARKVLSRQRPWAGRCLVHPENAFRARDQIQCGSKRDSQIQTHFGVRLRRNGGREYFAERSGVMLSPYDSVYYVEILQKFLSKSNRFKSSLMYFVPVDKHRHERPTVPGENVSGGRKLLRASARPITNRPQVANLPHVVSPTRPPEAALKSSRATSSPPSGPVTRSPAVQEIWSAPPSLGS